MNALQLVEETGYKKHQRGIKNVYPLFYWSEYEIWEYIDTNKLPYCSLYDEGFSRIGCVVCPFVFHPKQYERHRDRWPKYYLKMDIELLKIYQKKRNDDPLGYGMPFNIFKKRYYHGIKIKNA